MSPSEPTGSERPRGDSAAAAAPRQRSRGRELVAIGATVALVFLGLIVGLGVFTSSPLLCNGCHEMRPAVASWHESAHAEVNCFQCHQAPRPWYRYPQTVSERLGKLQRYFSASSQGSYDSTKSAARAAVAITDASCLQCHDPSRTPTPRFGIKIQHAKHAKRNKKCVTCHVWTAHPDESSSKPSQMMAQCFTCHGLGKNAKAPGECSLCHQDGLDLRPNSHKTGNWPTSHGKIALSDPTPCTTCHRATFCVACHKTPIPHAADWATDEHQAVGARDPEVCANCHKGSDPCGSCHHGDFDESQGSWRKQHPASVKANGATSCRTCHETQFCLDCHESQGSQ